MPSAISRHMGPREWAILILLSILWGGSFFFLHIAVQSLQPFTVVFLRAFLAAVILVGVLWVTGRGWPIERRTIVPFVTVALLNNVIPFFLFAWGQQHITSGLASILNATAPLWTVVVAHFFTADEKATPLKLLGVAIGFAGVALMIGGDLLHDIAGDNLVAQLACVGAALSYTLASVHARRFRSMGIPPITVTAGSLIACAAIALPLALVLDQPWHAPAPSLATVGAILGLATLSTALAYILYFRLIDAAGATNAILVTFLIPITAILLGATVLGEMLEPRHFAGMALIGLGLVAIDGRLLARRRPPTPA